MPRNANQSKQSNYSIDFDGSSQYIDTTLDIAYNYDFSVSFWFNWDQDQKLIITDGNFDAWSTIGFGFQIMSSGEIKLLVGDNGSSTGKTITTSAGSISANNWYHIVGVCDLNNEIRLYLNGASVDSTSVGSSRNETTNNIRIGGDYSSTKRLINGQISEVAIFNYALSPSQVTTLWGGGTSVSNSMALPSPPIAYYPLGTSAYNGQYLAENNAIGDYVFDNIVSSAINTPYNLTATSNITVSIWFKTTTNAQSNKYLFSYGNNQAIFDLRLNGTDAVQPIIKIAGVQIYPNISFNYADGNWHQYIVNYDGSNIKVYIDGILKNKSSYSGNLSVGSTNFVFANLSTTTGVTGEVSNCTIHTATLTDGNVSQGSEATGEIATFYNYGSPIQTLSSIPQNSDLKVWYKLDASEIYNSSTTEWSIDNNQNPSAYQSSLDFDGTNDKITGTGALISGNGSRTISLWYKTSSTAAQIPFSLGGPTDQTNGSQFAYCINRNSTTTAAIFGKDSAYDTAAFNVPETSDGNWHHLLITYDQSALKVFLDGNLEATPSPPSSYVTSGGFTIGGWSITGNRLFDGEISNVQIFNTALTTTNVASLYNNGTPLSDMSSFTSLVSWYKLNNTTTGIQDSKGSNNGTNNGATEYPGFVNTLVGDSSGMTQSNLVQSDLQTVAPYSKYALDFDGTNDYIDCGTGLGDSLGTYTGDLTLSYWFNTDSLTANDGIFTIGSFSNTQGEFQVNIYSNSMRFRVDGGTPTKLLDISGLNTGTWYHIGFVYKAGDITNSKVYLNGAEQSTTDTGTFPSLLSFTGLKTILGGYYGTGNTFNGKLSNLSFWNTSLTSAQVTELYNEGLPSNLNSHSAYSNLVSWWQLGENSSFATNWICADEKGSNNGTSANMIVANLTNGVGTTANGVSSGMSEGNLVGDAPYSTANALSSGMSVVSRVTGSGNTP